MVDVGGQVTGTIDNRFDQGYLVTVDIGSKKLSGFLYHMSSDSPTPSCGTHNTYQLALRESSPEPDMSGYDVFFTEHYVMLKPLYHGQENIIRKRIQVLWSTLTEEEKQVNNDCLDKQSTRSHGESSIPILTHCIWLNITPGK
ncbi:hypothetical protein L1987_02483 [Smallanthus sonchifolius]|uniref:Uncharacterized protein n=1 Tax=Smallanthus sonchifolius TaxID=185202 RepID=A0ACB9K7Y0_9ASTR|nr:hypothetical protein L1987_02483 [Smallanthus sonchifolius]